MPEQIDSISIKVTLDDSLVLKQLNRIKSIAGNISVKLNTNSFNNQVNGLQNRLNNLLLNPQIGQGIGVTLGQQISNDIAKNITSNNLISNALGEVIGAGVISKSVGSDISKVSGQLNTDISKVSSQLNTNISKISDQLNTNISKVSDQLKTDISILSGKLKTDIESLEKSLERVWKPTPIEDYNKEVDKFYNNLDSHLKDIKTKKSTTKIDTGELRIQKALQDSINRQSKQIEKELDSNIKNFRKKYKIVNIPIKYTFSVKKGEVAKYLKSVKPPPLPKSTTIKQNILAQQLTTKGLMGAGFLGKLGISTAVLYGIRATIRELTNLAKEASTSLEITAKLNSVLKSTGNTTGFTSSQLNDMANDISRLTNFTDEQITSAQTLLATYSNIKGDIFNGAIKGATDLASIFKVDVVTSAKLIGKLLNDPLANLNALKKAGISFSDVQKKQIELLINQNKLYEAQKIILDEINSKVGNAAINNANLITQISNSWDEVRERIGGILIDIVMINGDLQNTKNNIDSISSSLDGWKKTQGYVDTIATLRLLIASTVDSAQLLGNILMVMFDPIHYKEYWSGIKQQLIDLKEDWNKFDDAINRGPNNIPKLFKDTKTPEGLKKSEDVLTKSVDKAKELKDTINSAFNITDISNWWDTFLQSTEDISNKLEEVMIGPERQLIGNRDLFNTGRGDKMFDNSFNNPNQKDVGSIIEETNDEQIEAIDESNMWLGQIAKNVGVFA